MSRGPGVWQRKIVEQLETDEAFYLWELMPEGYSAKHRLACNRAAHRLAEMGRITLRWYMDARHVGSGHQRHGEVMVGRLGVKLDQWAERRWAWKRSGLSETEIAARLVEWHQVRYESECDDLRRQYWAFGKWTYRPRSYPEILGRIGSDTP